MASSQQARLVESTRGGFILEPEGYRYQKIEVRNDETKYIGVVRNGIPVGEVLLQILTYLQVSPQFFTYLFYFY